MVRLAVMAHYDPRGQVAPHVRRQVAALAAAADLVSVTTSELTDDARRFLSAHGRLVERTNHGYDFLSYKVGLEGADLTAYEEVTVCNDSYVGPLRPYSEIFDSMSGRLADFWGLSETDRVSHHVQSFFVTFRPAVIASPSFRSFWADLQPLSERKKVIRRYEVGLSQRLYGAGFTSEPYFRETASDARLARRRVRWWQLRMRGLPRTLSQARQLKEKARVPWNPAAALADRVLDHGRLPYVKIDTLRYDPYGLNADRLLGLCEEAHPEAFEGVRAWLADTADFYPPRPAEVLPPLPVALRPLRRAVEYRRAD